MAQDHVVLKQGAGGRAMRRLIEEVFLPGLVDMPVDGVGLAALDDGAALRVGDLWLVMTTYSHVVQPVFFPDFGRLAICGTVNDLAMMGATKVLGLACAVVLEDGFPRADLVRIQASLRDACLETDAPVVTGGRGRHRRRLGLVSRCAAIATWSTVEICADAVEAGRNRSPELAVPLRGLRTSRISNSAPERS
jgi:hydrogenase maturation factor